MRKALHVHVTRVDRSVGLFSHQIDITETVQPEGVQCGGDSLELVVFKALLTLQNSVIESGAHPPVHTAQRIHLKTERNKGVWNPVPLCQFHSSL